GSSGMVVAGARAGAPAPHTAKNQKQKIQNLDGQECPSHTGTLPHRPLSTDALSSEPCLAFRNKLRPRILRLGCLGRLGGGSRNALPAAWRVRLARDFHRSPR